VTGKTPGRLFGLARGVLRPGERVLEHWPAPHGRGLLTDQRCLLLGPPAPFRRKLRWSEELEKATSLEVIEPSFPPSYRIVTQVRGGKAGAAQAAGVAEIVDYDRLFFVNVNDVTVFAGHPDRAAEIQRWIDRARTARMVAVLGDVRAPVATATSGPSEPRAKAPDPF